LKRIGRLAYLIVDRCRAEHTVGLRDNPSYGGQGQDDLRATKWKCEDNSTADFVELAESMMSVGLDAKSIANSAYLEIGFNHDLPRVKHGSKLGPQIGKYLLATTDPW
jgi:hypothetical protein